SVMLPITSAMRMAVHLLKDARDFWRTGGPIAAEPQDFLALEIGAFRHLHDEQVRPQLFQRSRRLHHRPHRCGPYARHLVGDTTGKASAAPKQYRRAATAAPQTLRPTPHPVARLAIALRQ